MFIRIENLKVHYKVNGTGDPILLVHGWGGDISYFSKLVNHLSQKFTVYALDLPGFGLSTVPREVWGSAEYADLLQKFICELGIVQPILLGHSLGGKIVAHLVAHNSNLAKKIILVGSSGARLPKSLLVKARVCFFKLLKFLAGMPVIKDFVEPFLDVYRKKFGSRDYWNASGIMRSILVKTVNENIVSILPNIKVPALLLWGDQDAETPIQAGHIMQQSILGSELKIISGSGHFPFLDNWEKFIQELDKFLT